MGNNHGGPSGGHDMVNSTTEGHPLFSLYRRYLGEPSRRTDVFVGFALFFGGITIGFISLLVFLASVAVGGSSPYYWILREAAIVLGTIGLPALLISIVVLLPVSKRAIYTSLGGVALCMGGTTIFIATYPHSWNVSGQDYSPYGISVYAAGLVLLIASTGAALVAHHLSAASSDMIDPERTSESGTALADVTEEEVRHDIDETVEAADLTWGGVEPSEPRKLRLKETTDEDLDASGLDVNSETVSSTGVDDSVAELRKLRGWQPKTERGKSADEQVEALKTLRKRTAEETPEAGWLQDIVHRIRGG